MGDGDRGSCYGAMTVKRLRVLEARIEKLSIGALTVDLLTFGTTKLVTN